MSNACDTLSPRPPVLTGPTSTISADDFLGLENDHGEGSIRSNRNEVVDLENGDGQGPSAERNETLHLPFGHRESEGRPKLIQRSKSPKIAIQQYVRLG